MVGRKIERGEMSAFILWSSLFAVAPLLAATIWFEGAHQLVATLVHPDAEMAAIIAWQALANTLWGYTVWNRLLGRYSAAQVAPLTLPVPVIAGLLSSVALSEQISGWKIEACALVLFGLAVNVLGGRRRPQ
jgi:O-acetylserine/cysteine efflux transporter